MKKLLFLLILTTSVSIGYSQFVWEGLLSNAWENPDNWIGGVVPGDNAVVILNNINSSDAVISQSTPPVNLSSISISNSIFVVNSADVSIDVVVVGEGAINIVGFGQLYVSTSLDIGSQQSDNDECMVIVGDNAYLGVDNTLIIGGTLAGTPPDAKLEVNGILEVRGDVSVVKGGKLNVNGKCYIEPLPPAPSSSDKAMLTNEQAEESIVNK